MTKCQAEVLPRVVEFLERHPNRWYLAKEIAEGCGLPGAKQVAASMTWLKHLPGETSANGQAHYGKVETYGDQRSIRHCERLYRWQRRSRARALRHGPKAWHYHDAVESRWGYWTRRPTLTLKP